ncbi:MAG: hypothetical protein A3G23_02205 [Bacteroidetes bacterium RIFCSPLOWO2_12_FULL_37_12]|nr:MAG: hypothetical protein A3G23_02205 [Bacteroidetes bacterium RIFCSPLOWO2_12_FULL_37_12]
MKKLFLVLVAIQIIAPVLYSQQNEKNQSFRVFENNLEKDYRSYMDNSLNPALDNNLLLMGFATGNDGNEYMYWTISGKVQLNHFVIEKFYMNHWEYISGIEAQDNFNEPSGYQVPVTHTHGKNQYRLKMVDSSGGISYSKIMEVVYNENSEGAEKTLVILNDNSGNFVAFKARIIREKGYLVALNKPQNVSSGIYRIVGSTDVQIDGRVLAVK